MSNDVIKLVISLEDQPHVAHRLLDSLVDVQKRFVSYKTKTGRSRTVDAVAYEAYEAVAINEALTALLVDLVKDPQSNDVGYGLEVIGEFTKIAKGDKDVSVLLRDENFLTIAVTNFEPKPQDLLRVWGDPAGGIKVSVIRDTGDIDRYLKEKASQAQFPVVQKINHERLIQPLVSQWFTSRVPV